MVQGEIECASIVMLNLVQHPKITDYEYVWYVTNNSSEPWDCFGREGQLRKGTLLPVSLNGPAHPDMMNQSMECDRLEGILYHSKKVGVTGAV